VLTGLRASVYRFGEARGFLLAAALSFSLLVCLAPLTLLFFSGTGFLLASDQAAGSVIQVATSFLPGDRSQVLATLDLLGRERRVTGAIGAIGLAVAATPLFGLTRTAMNAAFQVRRDRGLVHGFAFDLFALGVVGLLAIALAGALLLLAALTDLAASVGVPSSFLAGTWVRAVAPLMLYAALLGLLFFVYRTFPNTSVSTRAAAIAALIVTVLWEGARQAFAAYLANFGTYGRLYGSFGVVGATLAWIYYSAAIFVFGAALTAVMTARRAGRAPEPAATAAPAAEPIRRRPWFRLPAYLASGLLGAALVLFALQNPAPTTLRLFTWTLADVPLAGVVLGALAAGALGAGLPLWIARRSPRSRARASEARREPE